MDTEVETTRGRHPSVLRKGLAGIVLIVAVALVLKLLIGFVIGIFWVIVAVALVVAILWALKTLVW
jgi:hypothetical protein